MGTTEQEPTEDPVADAPDYDYRRDTVSRPALVADLAGMVDSGTAVAPGATCRTQRAAGPSEKRIPHPVEKLADVAGTNSG